MKKPGDVNPIRLVLQVEKMEKLTKGMAHRGLLFGSLFGHSNLDKLDEEVDLTLTELS